MPTIFLARCDTCGKGPEVRGSIAGWEAEDRREGGKRFSDGCLALKLDDGKLVVLSHPGGFSALKKLGFTAEKARREERLYAVGYRICSQCGLVHEEARLCERGNWVWLAFPGVGVISFTLCRIGLGLPWGMCGFVAMMVTFAAVFLHGFLGSMGWRKTDEGPKLMSCTGCGSRELTIFSEAIRNRLPCPLCKTNTMRYTCDGIS